ncbi:hypothetical protein Droror1_Dr00008587, partial [Drosera rotundifolia]
MVAVQVNERPLSPATVDESWFLIQNSLNNQRSQDKNRVAFEIEGKKPIYIILLQIWIVLTGSSDLHLDYRQRRSFFDEHHNFIDPWPKNAELVLVSPKTSASWFQTVRSNLGLLRRRVEGERSRQVEKLNQPDLSFCRRSAFIPVILSPEKLNLLVFCVFDEAG